MIIKAFESERDGHLEVLQQALKSKTFRPGSASRKQIERLSPEPYLPCEIEWYKPRQVEY
ncbi:hypothetical protein BVG16_30650 [Paenibacillus selenitireducens]|uniref:Uncharacterized protein n=1 Tax=Paenibacillus selenitireducens TaxID=1324314 RepID=A0A1T2WZK2_9BACL|nr:hypothetical protein BVG16_30650 [Paenibacillus selenitireducens]